MKCMRPYLLRLYRIFSLGQTQIKSFHIPVPLRKERIKNLQNLSLS